MSGLSRQMKSPKEDELVKKLVYKSLQQSAEVEKFLAKKFQKTKSPKSPHFTKMKPYYKGNPSSPAITPKRVKESPPYLNALSLQKKRIELE